MNQTQFRKRLSQVIPLVLTYATDYFDLTKYKNPAEAFKTIGQITFINKCHEGYKKAQDIILNSVLELEDEIALIDSKIKKLQQTIHRRDLVKSDYPSLVTQRDTLSFQKAAFHDIANLIVWTLYKLDRITIKSLLQPDMHNKSLREGNIESVIKLAKKYNQDENKFAFITDLSSCVGMGDIILMDSVKGTSGLMEVKEGKVNDLILNALHTGNYKNVDEYITNHDKNTAKKFVKQFKRVLDQHEKSLGALTYSQTGLGIDLFTKKPKRYIESSLVDIKNTSAINENLKKLYSSNGEKQIYVFFECGIVALVKKPTLSDQWDFQHFIYHSAINPQVECAYSLDEPIAMRKPQVIQHFSEIRDIKIYNLKNTVGAVAHEPLLLQFEPNYSLDIFTDELGIYTYFHPGMFFDLCKKFDLNPVWVDFEKAVAGNSRFERQNFVNFDGKALGFGTKNHCYYFTYGFLFRIVYEFQSPESVINQMKALVDSIIKVRKSANP